MNAQYSPLVTGRDASSKALQPHAMMRSLVVECESRARVTDVRDARRACDPFELGVPSVRMRARRVGRGPRRIA